MTTAAPTAPPVTVPALAEDLGIRVDALRKLLRKRSDLAAMLVIAGPVRLVPPAAAEAIRAAVGETRAAPSA